MGKIAKNPRKVKNLKNPRKANTARNPKKVNHQRNPRNPRRVKNPRNPRKVKNPRNPRNPKVPALVPAAVKKMEPLFHQENLLMDLPLVDIALTRKVEKVLLGLNVD